MEKIFLKSVGTYTPIATAMFFYIYDFEVFYDL